MDLARAIALFQSDDEGDVNGALLKRAAATGGSRLPLPDFLQVEAGIATAARKIVVTADGVS